MVDEIEDHVVHCWILAHQILGIVKSQIENK
jgi:hypothetical protein